MRLTGPGLVGEPADRTAACRVLERALDLGVTLIDTADCYGPGISEEIIAEVLTPRGVGDVVVATKGGFVRSDGARGTPRGAPEHLRAACAESLARLRLDQVQLYQLHAVDPAVPIEESVGALVELRDEGKIRLVGLSNVTLDELQRALTVTPIASVQNRYNLDDRRSDALIEFCAAAGIAFLPWGPLSLKADSPVTPTIAAVAEEVGASTKQVVIAWMLARSPAIVMIPGTRSFDHVDANVRAAEITLSDAQFERLDTHSRAEFELLNDVRPAGQLF